MTSETDNKQAQPNTKSPQDWAKYWDKQFVLARKKIRKWHKDGDKVNDRYLGKPYSDDDNGLCEVQLNLFHSNITTIQSMLFGQIPKVEVDRTFADANDDDARVAGEIAGRMLNQDIQDAGEDYATTLRSALQDRLIPGCGSARVIYDFTEEEKVTPPVVDETTGKELAPEVRETKVVSEWVDEVYLHWKDVLWSPCRTWSEMRWRAYRSYMDFDELVKRFGEDLAKSIPLSSKGPTNSRDGRSENDQTELQPQAEVWEIWNKPNRKVYWFVEHMDRILEEKDDYLGLDGFWPEPPPMMANNTTSEYLPRPDYAIAQDLYREIDELETRITLLTRACKAVGVYDKSSTAVARMLTEGVENQLIPADNWAMFAEKGGIAGCVDWLPIEDVANVVQVLTQQQQTKIQQLYEVTGIADTIRGASQAYEAAATTKVKAQFASIRIQALQEEFARFASDLQSLKFEIIQKHFQPECIIYQSNIDHSMDAEDPQMIQRAVALLKDRQKARWRIRIRPETLAMADYAQLKIDRGEYITALSTFMQSAAPLAEMDQAVVPTLLLPLLQWGLAGFKGSNQIEGVIDRAIMLYKKKAEDAAANPKPDPEQQKIQAEQQKMQMEAQMKKDEMQAKMQLDREKHQMEMQQDQMKFQQEMRQSQQEFQMRMQEMMMEFSLKMKQMTAELSAQKQEQQAQFAYNTAEREHQLSVDKQKAELKPEGKSGE